MSEAELLLKEISKSNDLLSCRRMLWRLTNLNAPCELEKARQDYVRLIQRKAAQLEPMEELYGMKLMISYAGQIVQLMAYEPAIISNTLVGFEEGHIFGLMHVLFSSPAETLTEEIAQARFHQMRDYLWRRQITRNHIACKMCFYALKEGITVTKDSIFLPFDVVYLIAQFVING